jgi:hypothetical protein
MFPSAVTHPIAMIMGSVAVRGVKPRPDAIKMSGLNFQPERPGGRSIGRIRR